MSAIVIDTCTLKHASDSKSKYFTSSCEFIERMSAGNVKCTFDEGFSLNPTENRSYIGLEYLTHLKPGTLGYILVAELLISGRYEIVSNRVPQNTRRAIEQMIRNKKDRMFLRVAINCSDRLMASHDFTDYQVNKRKTIRKRFDVAIETAEEIIARLVWL